MTIRKQTAFSCGLQDTTIPVLWNVRSSPSYRQAHEQFAIMVVIRALTLLGFSEQDADYAARQHPGSTPYERFTRITAGMFL